MPSFEVEFEVYCGTCGGGLCSQSTGRSSRSRHYPQVVVEACENCIDKAKRPLLDEISEMNSTIEQLRMEIDELCSKLDDTNK